MAHATKVFACLKRHVYEFSHLLSLQGKKISKIEHQKKLSGSFFSFFQFDLKKILLYHIQTTEGFQCILTHTHTHSFSLVHTHIYTHLSMQLELSHRVLVGNVASLWLGNISGGGFFFSI